MGLIMKTVLITLWFIRNVEVNFKWRQSYLNIVELFEFMRERYVESWMFIVYVERILVDCIKIYVLKFNEIDVSL